MKKVKLFLIAAAFVAAFGTAQAQQNVCSGSNENYKIDSPAAGSSFTWSLDGGGIIVPVAGTTTEINIVWDGSAGNSVISVFETNTGGCAGDVSQLAVNRLSPPAANITGNATLCAVNGGSAVSINLTGTSPWDLNYKVNGVSTTQSGIVASPFIIPAASIGTTTVYELVSVSNAGCSVNVSGTATLAVLPAMNALQIIHR
jgi:hypothetical protein